MVANRCGRTRGDPRARGHVRPHPVCTVRGDRPRGARCATTPRHQPDGQARRVDHVHVHAHAFSGGIKCDLTVTRLGDERFLVVTGGGMGLHDLHWIQSHLPDDRFVTVADVSSGRCCIGLWGPRARDVLSRVTEDAVSNDGFPYMTAKPITIGEVPVTRPAHFIRRRAWLGAVRFRSNRVFACGTRCGRPAGRTV